MIIPMYYDTAPMSIESANALFGMWVILNALFIISSAFVIYKYLKSLPMYQGIFGYYFEGDYFGLGMFHIGMFIINGIVLLGFLGSFVGNHLIK